jgi:hypothetical protein
VDVGNDAASIFIVSPKDGRNILLSICSLWMWALMLVFGGSMYPRGESTLTVTALKS